MSRKKPKTQNRRGLGTVEELDTKPQSGSGLFRMRCRWFVHGRQRKRTIQVDGWTSTERFRQAFDWLAQEQRQHADVGTASTALTWLEGAKVWKEKAGATYNAQHLIDVERVAGELDALFPHLAIEQTTARQFSAFMDWKRDRRRKALEEQEAKRERPQEIARNAGNATANKARTLLFGLASNLKNAGEIPRRRYPFEEVPTRTWKQHRGKALTADSLQRYIEAIERPELRLPIQWISLTGWRSGAVCDLKKAMIDDSNPPGYAYQTMKRDKSRAEPLDDYTLAIIHEALALQDKRGWESEYLFVNSNGTKWTNATLYRAAMRTWEKAGLSKIKLHDLRTTFATEALKHFAVAETQAALGHSTLQATEHYNDQEQMDIAKVASTVRPILAGKFRATFAPKKGEKAGNSENGQEDPGETYVTILCPEIGYKSLIPKKKALQLLGL